MSDRPGPRVSPTMLQDVGLFGGLDEESLTVLARELPTAHVEAGKDVVTEGEPATEMFIVIGGELEVLKSSRDGTSEVRVAVFGPGDWFGEMAILDVQPRSATVRAVAPTTSSGSPTGTTIPLSESGDSLWANSVCHVLRLSRHHISVVVLPHNT